MDTSKSVTIYDIAKLAGTSPSTVGAVMNGSWKNRRISETRALAIKKLADEMGYSLNMQASALRKESSNIIGMIVPMHDNRYFSSISQEFEKHARSRGLFPIISSTLRDPAVEEEAVRRLLDYQVERIVCTGATDPDNIAEICSKRGVRTFNLDLPGTKAPSVISDNFAGAVALTTELIAKTDKKGISEGHFLFIGGRPNDHNTLERIRGFRDAIALSELSQSVYDVQTCGYAADKAEAALEKYVSGRGKLPAGIFVNSTISLEGVMNWFSANGLELLNDLAFGCFDWDPFAALVHPRILMARQNVPEMVTKLYELMDKETVEADIYIQIPPTILGSLENRAGPS